MFHAITTLTGLYKVTTTKITYYIFSFQQFRSTVTPIRAGRGGGGASKENICLKIKNKGHIKQYKNAAQETEKS